MGQKCATQHGGGLRGPDPPGWRPAAGWAVPAGCTCSTETAVDREEHSGGALRGSTHKGHSGGALSRRTKEEHSRGHSRGALTVDTQREHSRRGHRRSTRGALSGSTQEGHLRRSTQGEHSRGDTPAGALRRSIQERGTQEGALPPPAMLSWALRASPPASKFEAPFARLTDGPCVPCPPWRPCHPIAQQRQVASPQPA